jgi:hypothetical protein
MELKSRCFTSKEPHVAREPLVDDPCSRPLSSRYTDEAMPAVLRTCTMSRGI